MTSNPLDLTDSLASFRDAFFFSDEQMIYLDGNSLGRMPLQARALLHEAIDRQWGERLIRSWNEEWMGLSERIGAKIAQLVGAQPDEVILTDTTSINLFKLAYAALTALPERHQIVTDNLNFPSDIYVLEGLRKLFGMRHDILMAKSLDEMTINDEALQQLISPATALVTLTHVCFKSSFMYDMKRVTSMAHNSGALILWDLSHATGAVPVELNRSNADLAVGCTYKYLNGGPGSLAFLYVRKDLQEKLINPLTGWFGHSDPFDFRLDFNPAHSIRRFLTSTPPVFAAGPVEAGVDLLLDAGMDRIRAKSLAMTNYLIELFDEYLAPLGFTLGTPRNPNQRGSHISLRHPEGYRICQALIHPPANIPVIIPDFRAPDFIRLGITPLYTRFADLSLTVERLMNIVDQQEYLNFSAEREQVT